MSLPKARKNFVWYMSCFISIIYTNWYISANPATKVPNYLGEQRELCSHGPKEVPTFYSMVVKVDATMLRQYLEVKLTSSIAHARRPQLHIDWRKGRTNRGLKTALEHPAMNAVWTGKSPWTSDKSPSALFFYRHCLNCLTDQNRPGPVTGKRRIAVFFSWSQLVKSMTKLWYFL